MQTIRYIRYRYESRLILDGLYADILEKGGELYVI